MDEGIQINTVDDGAENRVDLSSLNVTPVKKKKHAEFKHEMDLSKTNAMPIRPGTSTGVHGTPPHHKGANEVAPHNATVKPSIPSSNNRQSINIDAIAAPEPEDPNKEVHVSPIDDLLNPENPNSAFANYVKQKDEEAAEWIAEYQETKALEAEEKAIESEGTDQSSENIGDSNISYMKPRQINYEMDDDLDLSRLDSNGKDKEETTMSEEKIDEIEIDAGVDKEDLPTYEEVTASQVEEEVDTEDEDDGAVCIDEDDEEVEDEVEEDTPGDVIGVIPGVDDAEKKEEAVYAGDIAMVEDSNTTFSISEEDIEEDIDNAATTVGSTDDDEVLKHLQKLATERLKPVSERLDISSFTVLKKPVVNVNPIFEASSARVVKWVLPSQESIVLMKEFSGSELEKLREYSENTRSVDALNRRYHLIYDHIASPKPATFEQWLKSTPLEDVDHYFFAIYIASFKGANYLPMDCPNPECKETFITDDINIMDMVKFDNEEAKKKFTEIYQSETTPAGKGVYCTEIVPISNQVAIQFRQPSIYNFFEIASMSEKARNNYASIIDYVPFIDTVYMIDAANQSLVPVGYKTFADNAAKTVESKLKKFDQVFSTLNVDNFGPIKAYARALGEKNTGMHYVYPAAECPKCHKEIEEQTATAEQLVFTRYQLGSLVTTSLS